MLAAILLAFRRWAGGADWSPCWQPGARGMQFRFLHDVVAVKDGPGPVAGQLHGDPLGDPGPDQIPGGGAAAVVQQPPRHPRPLTRLRPCRPPRPDGPRIASINQGIPRPRRWARRRASTVRIGAEIASTRPTRVFERSGDKRTTPPAGSTSLHRSSRISRFRQPE